MNIHICGHSYFGKFKITSCDKLLEGNGCQKIISNGKVKYSLFRVKKQIFSKVWIAIISKKKLKMSIFFGNICSNSTRKYSQGKEFMALFVTFLVI